MKPEDGSIFVNCDSVPQNLREHCCTITDCREKATRVNIGEQPRGRGIVDRTMYLCKKHAKYIIKSNKSMKRLRKDMAFYAY